MTPMRWQRRLSLVVTVLVLAGALALPAAAGGSAHPYFDDQGTLTWYHSLAEARQAAKREQKLIFVEYGRRICTNCRILCSQVLPNGRIRGRLGEVAVGLVAECDAPEPAVYWLFKRNLRNARMLPFAAFLRPDGTWVTGFAGQASVGIFETHLSVAERVQRRLFAANPTPEDEPRPVARTPALRPAPVPPAPRGARPAPDEAAETPAIEAEPKAPAKDDPCAAPIGRPDGDCGNRTCCPEDACGTDESCPGGNCAAPGLCLPGIGHVQLPGFGNPRCPPCRPEEPRPTARGGFCEFPTPAPSHTQAGRRLAAAVPPAPAPTAAGPGPYGSPDGDGEAPPTGNLPPPVVRPGRNLPTTPATRVAQPDQAVPAADSRARIQAAVTAGDWATVIRGTRGAPTSDAEMMAWNRQAHAWAHGRLAGAVRALREGRYGEARQAVAAVSGVMRGEPEAVDAERGAEALELARDLEHLTAASPVRKAVRKNAYEKMRGTRWAPLFSDCPLPSPALSVR